MTDTKDRKEKQQLESDLAIEQKRVELLSDTYKVPALTVELLFNFSKRRCNANFTALTGFFSSLTDYILPYLDYSCNPKFMFFGKFLLFYLFKASIKTLKASTTHTINQTINIPSQTTRKHKP